MKKLYFLIAFLMLSAGSLLAQSFSVKSFQPLTMDMTASSLEGKRIDQNGEVAALIKIVTSETGFTFEGGTLGIVDSKQENGEVWVWVPRASRKITIKHQLLGVLRDYRYPVEIEAERTYEMVLTTAKIETVVKEEVRMQYLVFQISPPNATLVVDEKFWEVEADGSAQDYVSFGTYTWRVEAPNYHSDAGRVIVDDPNNAKIVPVTLQPNFGWIEVAGTGNLQDASVYVDNVLVGRAPCKSEALKSGKHAVRITKKMYDAYTETVMVNDNETTQLAPTLTADFAEVTLKVDADAEIWVNDEKIGVRSWTGLLSSGTYKIECKQAGHENTLTTQEITANMPNKTIILPAPRPIYGSLNVESTPNFCKLFIDGKDIGTTPKALQEILVGTHKIRLTKEGYADYTETVTITKGERKQMKAVLNKQEVEQQRIVSTTNISYEDLTFTVDGVSFTMKFVEGGTFQMGATSEQGSDSDSDEKPAHIVTLSSYYIGETEVTQALWQAVMGSNPSYFKGDNLPVEQVTWNDCQEFICILNQKTGRNFRLPTEAEWEYAARGGKKSEGYKYSGSNTISSVAWCTDNSGDKTHMVKTKSPNELGLYDMSGNVYEWCSDWYGRDYYGKSPSTNPQGPSTGSYRVLRGGRWYCRARYCRVSYRSRRNPAYRYDLDGFRLALSE